MPVRRIYANIDCQGVNTVINLPDPEESGDAANKAYVDSASLAGNDGREVELGVSATHVQWRYVGDATWLNLIALSSLAGADGREIQLQASATHIQWRYAGETVWIDLIALSTLKGDKGDTGPVPTLFPNQIFAGPASGGASAPAAGRALVGADLPPISDGLVFMLSNRGETAIASTNYAEVPVPVPSGSFTLVAVRFGCHIDTVGSSSTTFNAYRRTAAGVKTSTLTGNATLPSGASLMDASATISSGTFNAGDRIGVDLIGVGTGAQGLFAQFQFTRSAI